MLMIQPGLCIPRLESAPALKWPCTRRQMPCEYDMNGVALPHHLCEHATPSPGCSRGNFVALSRDKFNFRTLPYAATVLSCHPKEVRPAKGTC